MPWTVQQTSHYEKQLAKAGLLPAEQNKIDDWIAAIANNNKSPIVAARDLYYELRKLKGTDNQWEIYIGAKNRVSFTYDDMAEQVTLVSLGHT